MNAHMHNNDELTVVAEALQSHDLDVETTESSLRSLREELKQMTHIHDALLYQLFPSIRGGQVPTEIETRMEDLAKEVASLKEAEAKQEEALQKLAADLSQGSSFNHHVRWEDTPPCDLLAIAKRRSILDQLKNRHHCVQGAIDKLRTLLSPIRRIPVEILADIFTFCRPTKLDGTISLTAGLLSITHVCSAWRSIAIDKSHLWSTIFVTLKHNREVAGWLPLIDLWLKRSRDHPLSLSVTVESKYGASPTFYKILDMFTLHARRWKDVEAIQQSYTIWANGLTYFGLIQPQTKCSFLETLEIQLDLMASHDLKRLLALISQAPRLHTVFWDTPGDIPMHTWAQITNLTLCNNISLKETLDLLSFGHRLVYLRLKVELHSRDQHQIFDQVTHQLLEDFGLDYGDCVQALFSKITLPALTTMTIADMFSHPAWDNESFIAFLNRSGCSLQHLDLKKLFPMKPDDLLILLRKLSSSLITFGLEQTKGLCINDQVLQALAYPAIGSDTPLNAGDMQGNEENSVAKILQLCPMLQNLELRGCIDSTDGVLADMIESRLQKNIRQLSSSSSSSSSSLKILTKATLADRHKRPVDLDRLSRLHSDGITYSDCYKESWR